MPAQAVSATHAPAVKVNGSLLAADLMDQLTSARIQRSLGLVGRTTLRFLDAGFRLSSMTTFKLGAEVELSMPSSGAALFVGTVTGVSLEQSDGQVPVLAVTVDDAAVKLMRRSNATTYLKMRPTDLVSKLAQEVGLTADVPAAGEVVEYQLHTGSSLAFVNHLAERTGMTWWCVGRKLFMRPAGDSVGTASLTWGEGLRDFSVRATSLTPSKVTVTGWDRGTQARVVGEATAATASESAFVQHYRSRQNGTEASAVVVADRSPNTQGGATALAKAFVGEASTSAVLARGTCPVDPSIAPAVQLTVTDAGPASGSYLVSSVEHVYQRSGFETRFVAGPHRPSGLVDVLAPAAPSPGTVMHGVVVGIVSNNKDPENANSGMVKVSYAGVADQLESAWARVVSIGGGNQRGNVFVPEINDEVLVAFEGGDTSRPVVLGGLYSKKKGLPGSATDIENGVVNYRRMTSRLGHVIELADGTSPDAQHVLISLAGKKHRIRLGKDRLDIEADRVPLTVTNGPAKLDFTASGDVTLEGANITIKAQRDVTLEGLNIAVKAKVKASVEATNTEVKGKATAKVEAGGPLTLKGAMVAIN